MDIGEAVDEHMMPGLDPVWFDLEPTMYWMIKEATGVKFVYGNTRSDSGLENSYSWTKGGP